MATEKLMRSLRERQTLAEDHPTEKLFTFLQGFCSDKFNPKPQTIQALYLMRSMHQRQVRDSGQPYIIHPLSMAYFAITIGLTDDNLIATILLHDVCEDTTLDVDDLWLNDTVVQGIKLMTFEPKPYQNKQVAKREYYERLAYSTNAIICKAIDRYHNLSMAVGNISKQRVIKNIYETHELLLPNLRDAEEFFPEYATQLFLLQTILKNLNDNLALFYGIDLYSTTDSPPLKPAY